MVTAAGIEKEEEGDYVESDNLSEYENISVDGAGRRMLNVWDDPTTSTESEEYPSFNALDLTCVNVRGAWERRQNSRKVITPTESIYDVPSSIRE